MNELNLEWIESGSLRTQSITPGQPSKNPGTIRLGRDPQQCDIVLADGSVSGLHIEIFFDQVSQKFLVRNLRTTNPPIINGQTLPEGTMVLEPENTIQLGNLQIRAIATGDSSQPSFIPPTEIQAPGATQTAPRPPQSYPPAPIPPTYQTNPWASAPPQAVAPSQPAGFPPAQPLQGEPPRQKNFLWIIPIAILFTAVIGFAWPNISGFFGIGGSTVVEEPADDDTSDPQESGSPQTESFMADLESFEHPSRLFSISTPKDWRYEDNSEAGEIVISSWRHPRIYSLVVVRIEKVSRSLNRQEIGEVGQELITDLLGELDNFSTGKSTALFNGSVRIPWEGTDEGNELEGASFFRQDGSNFSHVIVWHPKRLSSQYKDLQAEINEVVKSLSVNPNVAIP